MLSFLNHLNESELAAIFALLPIIGAVIGFGLTRWWTRASAHEKAAHLNNLADLRSKLQAGGVSISDIEDFEAHLLSGTQSDAEAVLAAVSGDSDQDVDLDLPQQYWTTVAMNARASAKLASLDARLEEVLTDLGTLISDHENGELYKAQRAWRAYRARAMSYAASEYYGGTMAPLVGVAHGMTLTEERIAAIMADLADRKQRSR